MAAPLAFEILAEFKLSAAGALLESSRLKKSIDEVSDSAQRAIDLVNQVPMQLANALGLGGKSFFGVIVKAIGVQEKFTRTVTNFSAIITSNLNVFEGEFFDKFSNRVSYSTALVKKLSQESNRLGVQEGALFHTFKSVAFAGLQGGLQIKEIIQLASNAQLAAPVTGLDPALIGDQVFRLALQGVGGSPTLFKTLLADTDTFKKFKKTGGVREFGALNFEQRVQLIAKAFAEFGNKPEVLARQLNTISAQFAILSNRVTGVSGMLRELGAIFYPLVIEGLKEINAFIKNEGTRIFNLIRGVLKGLVTDLRGTFVNLYQISRLGKDISAVSNIFKMITYIFILQGAMWGLGLAFRAFGREIPMLIQGLDNFFGKIGHYIISWLAMPLSAPLTGKTALLQMPMGPQQAGFMGILIGFWEKLIFVLKRIPAIIGRITIIGTILLLVFQGISKGLGQLKVSMFDFWKRNTDVLISMVETWNNIFKLLMVPFQGFVNFIAYLVGSSWALETFNDLLITLAEGITWVATGIGKWISLIYALVAAISGAVGSIIGSMFAISRGLATGDVAGAYEAVKNMFIDAGYAAKESFINELDKSGLWETKKKPGEGLPTVGVNVNHNGDIIINNDIKEAFEPDRIAFTVTEQIQKALLSPTKAVPTAGGAGGSFLGNFLNRPLETGLSPEISPVQYF